MAEPTTPLFNFGDNTPEDVKVKLQDLIRNSFIDKYNNLAESTIYDITTISVLDYGTSGTSGYVEPVEKQVIQFHTNKGIIDIQIDATSGANIAEEVAYTHPTYTNVQDALDSLLFVFPSGSFTGSSLGNREVGNTSVFPFVLTATGIKGTKNLLNVAITTTGFVGDITTIPTPASQTPIVATFNSSLFTIDSSANFTYTWTARVKDTHTPQSNILLGTRTLRFVYPILTGSGAFDAIAADDATLETQMNILLNGGGLSVLVKTEPASESVLHTSGQYTYFLIPQIYGSLDRLEDGGTGLEYPYDTVSSPDAGAEWREREVDLTRTVSGSWTNIPYFVYASKTVKPTLTVKYVF